MMKIHTTQNLSSSADYRSTNIALPKQIRYTKYSDASAPLDMPNSDFCKSMSFKGKKSALNKAVEAGKKTFSERVASNKRIKNILKSDSFSKVAEFAGEQEVMIQAGTALAICCGLRPATTMAMPGDKNKKDCAFAAAHSFSSGVWGFIVPFLFIKPLTNGYNNALKNADKYIKKAETIKEFYPHVDLKKITDEKGARKIMDEWVDIEGNKFIADVKDVRKIPLPKHISEISDDTLKELMPEIDLATKANNASANKWLDKNGNKINMKFEDMFIAVEDSEKKGVKYYPLMHVKDTILKEVFPEVDIASIKMNGKRVHPNEWKTVEGKNFQMDMDKVFVSKWKESESVIPLITGETQEINGKVKDICYQKNNKEGDPYSLGTPIKADMLKAASINKVFDKFCSWLPDIVVAYPRATATIAIIPFVLKNVFGLEKSKEPKEAPIQEVSPKIEPQVQHKEVA